MFERNSFKKVKSRELQFEFNKQKEIKKEDLFVKYNYKKNFDRIESIECTDKNKSKEDIKNVCTIKLKKYIFKYLKNK